MKRIGLLGTLFVISFMFLVEAGLGAIKYCPDPLRYGYGTCAVYSDPGCTHKIGATWGHHYLSGTVECWVGKRNGLFYYPFPTCEYYCDGTYWINGFTLGGCPPDSSGWDITSSEGEACFVAWTDEFGNEHHFDGYWDSDWRTCVGCWRGTKHLQNNCSCSFGEVISPPLCEKACNALDILDEWPANKVKIFNIECPSKVARGKPFLIHVNSSGSHVYLKAYIYNMSWINVSSCQHFTYQYPCTWHISNLSVNAPESTGIYDFHVYGKGDDCPSALFNDYDTKKSCTIEVVECLSDEDCPAKNGTKGKCVCPEAGCSLKSPKPEELYKCKWPRCEFSSDCDVNYCCPREINPEFDEDCIDASAGTIINYGGKSYLCDPPGWSSNNEIQKAQISLPQNKKGKHDLLSSLVEYLVKIFSG